MKHYMIIAVLCTVSFNAFSIEPQYSPIVSVSSGSNSLVDAIKQQSDITESDVDKWKFLWLGELNAVPGVAMGGYAMVKAGQATNQAFEYVTTKEDVPAWLVARALTLPESLKKTEPWMAVAALGVGLMSYKIFYPRMRMGVVNKVNNFLALCSRLAIANSSPTAMPPQEWSGEDEIAVCKALNNVEKQAQLAGILLNQIGDGDQEIKDMRSRLKMYHNNLKNNKANFSKTCKQFTQALEQEEKAELQKQLAESQLFGMKIQNIKNVLSIMNKIGSFVYTGAKDLMTWGADNPAPASLIGLAYYYYWSKANSVEEK